MGPFCGPGRPPGSSEHHRFRPKVPLEAPLRGSLALRTGAVRVQVPI